MLTSAPSVSLSWVNTVIAAAERQGVPCADLLARAGVAHDRLGGPRWPVDDITRLWRAAAALTGDAALCTQELAAVVVEQKGGICSASKGTRQSSRN